MSKGVKYDGDKPRYDLIEPKALEDLARVLTFGCKKYSDENWRHVENAEKRYYSALLRHVEAWRRGDSLDEETGIPHLSHAMACLMFLHWFDSKKITKDDAEEWWNKMHETISRYDWGQDL